MVNYGPLFAKQPEEPWYGYDFKSICNYFDSCKVKDKLSSTEIKNSGKNICIKHISASSRPHIYNYILFSNKHIK